MSRKAAVTVLCAGAALLAILLVPTGAAVSQEVSDAIRRVIVTNFPESQKIEGEVTVRGPIRQTAQFSLKDIVVPPVSPKDTQRLIQAGTISTDGFAFVVLGLAGQIRGEVVRAGSVGAILLPEEDSILRAFEEKGELQFPLQVTSNTVTSASPFFASDQPRLLIGFPRYRVFLFNTSQKTVSVNLYAYLTN